MLWTSIVADIVALGAPVLGRALAGPVGAKAGALLARALGVEPKPEAVREAIERAPEAARTAIATAEAENADAIWAAQTRALEIVNETMRAEAGGDRVQRWWRPFVGYVFGLVSLAFGLAVTIDLALGRFEVVVRAAELAWFFGVMAAVVGASAVGRSVEKVWRGAR